MKILLFLLLIVCNFCIIGSTNAQRHDANWIFEDNFGVKFNQDGTLNFYEALSNCPGSALYLPDTEHPCISDSMGNLLFYRQSIFVSIRDSIHKDSIYGFNNTIYRNGLNQPMEEKTEKGDSRDSILASASLRYCSLLPYPGHPGLYYVITNENWVYNPYNNLYNIVKSHKGNFNLTYQIIDINAYEGKGAVISPKKIISNRSMSLSTVATQHANGVDWWVLAHGLDSSRTYYKYLLDKNGLSLHSTQEIGLVNDSLIRSIQDHVTDFISFMCFAPDGEKLAVIHYTGKIQLFSFNRCTGELADFKDLTNLRLWKISTSDKRLYPGMSNSDILNSSGYLSCVFSPDSKKIFTGGKYTFLQIDISDPNNIQKIEDSLSNYTKYLSGERKRFTKTEMRLSPHNNIWVNLIDDKNRLINHIGVIKNPNGLGPQKYDFDYKAVKLPENRINNGAFPSFPNFRLGIIPICTQTDTLICRHSIVNFGNNNFGTYNYSWSGIKVADSTVKILNYKFDSVGVYKFWRHRFSASQGCTTAVDTFVVEVQNKYFFSTRTDTLICRGSVLNLGKDLGKSYNYSWSGIKVADSTVKILRYKFDSVGVYKFWRHRFSASQGCTTAVDTFVVMVKTTAPPCVTALEKHSKPKTKVKIYPNPAQEVVMIAANQRILLIRFYDMNGKVVKEDIPDTSTQTHESNVQNLPHGIYLLQVETDGGSVSQRVVVE